MGGRKLLNGEPDGRLYTCQEVDRKRSPGIQKSGNKVAQPLDGDEEHNSVAVAQQHIYGV